MLNLENTQKADKSYLHVTEEESQEKEGTLVLCDHKGIIKRHIST